MNFLPVRINTLRASQPVSFDIYIKVGGKYLHYIRNADELDVDRILALRAKGVKKLFIPAELEPDYMKYLDAGLAQLGDKKVSVKERAHVAQETMTVAAENAGKNVQTAEKYKQTEDQVKSVMDFVLNEKGAFRQMMSVGVATDVYQHASHVVSISLKLAAKVGVTDPKLLSELGLGALLHDIGKEGDGLNPMIPKEKHTLEQRKIYESHPQRALDMVQDKAHVTQGVMALILNHEEIGDAAGFPGKKRLTTLPQTQQILNLCNEYDRVCTVNKTPPLEAIRQFRMDKIGLFDLKLIGHLADILKG